MRYDEGCLAAHALNVIGDRWALLVVRELMFAPKRFQAIRAGLPGITAGVLTQRLAQLQDFGVVAQDRSIGSYELTDAGRALMPVLQALCHWGVLQPGHDPRRFISPTALMISMSAMIDQSRIGGLRVTAGFDMGRECFVQEVDAEGRHLVRSAPEASGDFVLAGSANTLALVIYGPARLVEQIDAGFSGFSGARETAQTFLDLFRLRR